ncbi:MAG TPA: hypothetical protein VK425_10810, partial [Acidimicrobiales bacterium]|nr:hypothetical protein [Acidimicrobiales bacterium]
MSNPTAAGGPPARNRTEAPPRPAPALGTGTSNPARRYLEGDGRRTRVVATIGPASDNPGTLRAMQDAGMDVAR